jgi:hypothetical protein
MRWNFPLVHLGKWNSCHGRSFGLPLNFERQVDEENEKMSRQLAGKEQELSELRASFWQDLQNMKSELKQQAEKNNELEKTRSELLEAQSKEKAKIQKELEVSYSSGKNNC